MDWAEELTQFHSCSDDPTSVALLGHVSAHVLHVPIEVDPLSLISGTDFAQDEDLQWFLPTSKEKSWQSLLMSCLTRPFKGTFGLVLELYIKTYFHRRVGYSIHSNLTLPICISCTLSDLSIRVFADTILTPQIAQLQADNQLILISR
jgi:hypothetical protein